MYLMYIDIFSEKSIYARRMGQCDVTSFHFSSFLFYTGELGESPYRPRRVCNAPKELTRALSFLSARSA